MHLVPAPTLLHWCNEAREQAIAAEVSVTELDWFLQELTGLNKLFLRLELPKTQADLSLPVSLTELDTLWQQRICERVPVQYLAGRVLWRQFRLKVSPAVLIPRPETEGLIDLAIAAAQASTPLAAGHWVDLGTGSGAIALGLTAAFPSATVHAVDKSPEALEIARCNAEAYQLGDRIHFYQGSWLEPLNSLRGTISGIVSNPPYIPSQQVLELQPEVTNHEPHLALDGGSDGLDCIRYLIKTVPDYLSPNGVLLVEMMAGQAAIVTELLEHQGNYTTIQIHPDLAGVERFASAQRL